MHSHMYKHKTQNQTHIGSTQIRPFIGNVIWNKLLNDSAFCKMTVLLLWLKEAKEESAQDLLCVCVQWSKLHHLHWQADSLSLSSLEALVYIKNLIKGSCCFPMSGSRIFWNDCL